MPGLPGDQDVYVNRPLTNVSVAYQQAASRFIAHRVFPQVPVQVQGGRYFTYDKGDWFRSEAKLRAPGSESEGSGWRIDNTPTFFCDVFAVHKDIDRETRTNAQAPINLEREATQWTTHQLLLKRDLDWASKFFTTGVWGTDITGVSATPTGPQVLQWNDASADPMIDIHNYSVGITEKTAVLPSEMSLVIGPYVWNALRSNPAILDRIKYTQGPAIPTEAMVAQAMGIKEILVAWSVSNSAAEQVTDAMAFNFGKAGLLIYTPNSPGLMQPAGGYTFTWNGLLGSSAFGTRVRRLDVPLKNSTRVEGEMAYDMKAIATDVAVYFTTLVA